MPFSAEGKSQPGDTVAPHPGDGARAAAAAGGAPGLQWRELPEYRLADLTYERYCQHAAALEPFAVVDAQQQWPGAAQWGDLNHLLGHAAVDAASEEAELLIHPGPFQLEAESGDVPLAEAAAMLAAGAAAEGAPQTPLYLKWGFAHIPQLVAELPVHRFMVPEGSAPAEAADNPLLIRPGRFYCWVYAGQQGSGSKSHTDVLNSAAWLTLLRGRKTWLLADGGDLQKLTTAGGTVADLFELAERWEADPKLRDSLPEAPAARLYRHTQRPGCAVFVPSLSLHAVRNEEFGISVTHNFVDRYSQPHWERAVKDMLGAA
eukprot:TRINITY_DN5314_c0_g2_i1.p2 TRINITY_DN5314_c0_g2~~TRINITY_DN5314_c0_g2_i1.p2  ORF type:complete len:318 (+),score=117.06 TRINITY_DN5314_c0_g2_i1:75-1028(+)